MFTGIIEDKAKVTKVEIIGESKRIFLTFPYDLTDVQPGDSINIDGVCLTVIEKNGKNLVFDLSPETLKRTTLVNLKEGNNVNFERALRFSDRLGGHIVTGHVDDIGTIIDKRWEGRFLNLFIRIPKSLSKYVVPKGAIAIDGISLTINEIHENEIRLAIIPITIQKTTLGDKKIGDKVNLETDILAKYIEGILSKNVESKKELTISFLKEHGFIEKE